MKKTIISAVITTALSIMMAIPALAGTGIPSSSDVNKFNNNKTTTDVYLVTSDDAAANISATVPLKVVLAVKADGTIVSPTDYKISNTGVMTFHVSKIDTTLDPGYSFSSEKGNNTLNLTITPDSKNAVTLQDSTTIAHSTDWNVNGDTSLPIIFNGSVGDISADITSAQHAFAVSYTLTTGIAEEKQ